MVDSTTSKLEQADERISATKDKTEEILHTDRNIETKEHVHKLQEC
jgi:hypothetical protein